MVALRPLAALAALALPLAACAIEPAQQIVLVPVDATPVPAAAPVPAEPAQPAMASFTAVSSEGWPDVEVTVGASPSVRFACSRAALATVHAEVRGEHLRIWSDGEPRSHGKRGCTVQVALPVLRSLAVSGSGDARVHGSARELTGVSVNGSGNVMIDELQAHAASIAVEGSGDVRVAGASERLSIAVSGSGNIDARGLGAADVEVASSGSGDVAITASRRVSVVASGSGDVEIAGCPAERNALATGSGEIAFR